MSTSTKLGHDPDYDKKRGNMTNECKVNGPSRGGRAHHFSPSAQWSDGPSNAAYGHKKSPLNQHYKMMYHPEMVSMTSIKMQPKERDEIYNLPKTNRKNMLNNH